MPISNMASYPPGFRPTHQPGPITDPSDQTVDQLPDPLPVIDMACLDEAELHVACREWGIFRLVNHGIPERLIAHLLAEAKALFDLDFESKRAVLKDPNPAYSWGNPGLTPAGVQTPKGLPEVGWEIIHFPLHRREITCQEAPQETAITPFRAILEEYGEQMTTISKMLFKAVAKNLKLDQNLIEKGDLHKYIDETTGLLRVNRYPPSWSSDVEPQVQVKGLDAHTDSSVLTILLQDNVRGLELFKDGLWFPVKPIPNTLIVNVGDMLQAMSDDEYKSVEHKVTLNKHQERISVGYFVFPEENTWVTGSKGKLGLSLVRIFEPKLKKMLPSLGGRLAYLVFDLNRESTI